MVTDRIDSTKGGALQHLLETEADDRKLVEAIFLRTISRRPAPQEQEVAAKALASSGRRKGVENLQWALLNSPEFFFNY